MTEERAADDRAVQPKWKRRLVVELEAQRSMHDLSDGELRASLEENGVLSENHDTVVSLDWPHFCSHATEACGGVRGWCYTLSGHHVSSSHARKVALNDLGARRIPEAFAAIVFEEIKARTENGELEYANVRFSGSGEVQKHHVAALGLIAARGIRVWGFTKNPTLAVALRNLGIAAIFSFDHSTRRVHLKAAMKSGIPLAYSSRSVADAPPVPVLVTFPVHASGRVTEAIDHPTLCPKVVEEFLTSTRRRGWCQQRCLRCHLLPPGGAR